MRLHRPYRHVYYEQAKKTSGIAEAFPVAHHQGIPDDRLPPLLETKLHPLTATSLNNLAGLYHAQGKYEQAEPLLVRALAISEQQLGPVHPQTLVIQGNYAYLLRIMRRGRIRALNLWGLLR